jgi:uncharacterized protein YecE (DUF72 family)
MVELAEPRPRIGISGWTYPPWRGVFYPTGLRQADELSFAARAFSSIEINGSFYSLMKPASYQAWHDAVPSDFVFAVKGGRYVTHMKRLRNVESALANFFASGLLRLGSKLGPILWQLPPQLAFDAGRLRAFFELLPRTTRELQKLAARHDSWLSDRVELELHAPEQAVRYALEVRHDSFKDARYVDLLREHGIASCVADSAGLYPIIEDLTADFGYARLHGSKRLYVSGYGPRELARWAERVRAWSAGRNAPEPRLLSSEARVTHPHQPRPVFVYFDNDVKVRAPFDAQNLTRLLEGKRPRRLPSALQSVTEEPRSEWSAWQRRA